MSDENTNPKLLNMNGLVESMKVVRLCINKALKAGAFDNVDDVYLSKVALDNIDTAIQSLSVHQERYIEEQRNAQKNKVQHENADN